MQRISITNPQNIIDGTAKKYYFKLRNTGGPKGDKGDKGDTGATGPQGPQGNAATVSVGSTTTLPVGYDATVTNTGSIYNAVLDFGIPQGPQGPQGAKGDKGDTGAKGDTGPRGPQGERGTNATVYVGTTSTLNPGSQATVYNSGTDSNAVLNFGIPKGEKGDTGSQGPQGPTGPTGPAGQNFAPTIVAELPATGDSSKLYLTPKAHTTQTATGNPITASVTEQAGAIESFQLDGDTFQQTYTGQNLYNVATLSTGSSVTKDDDGWITITKDNSSGSSASYTNAWTDNLDLETSTQYAIFLEVKEASGTGELDITSTNSTQGQFSSWQSKQIASLTKGTYKITATTKSSFSGIYGGLRTILNLSAGQSASITFRLSVCASSTPIETFSYEPYVGGQPSPSPDYPQAIQTVTGEQTVEIEGKNLFDKTSQISNGYTYSSTGTKDVLANSSVQESYITVLPNTTYTLHTDATSSQATNFRVFICEYDSGKGFIQRDIPSPNTSNTNTITTTANTYFVRLCFSTVGIDTLQFEKSESPTAYASYSKQTYPINLGKNLFDKNNATISHFYPHVSEIRQNDSAVSIVLPVEAGTTYTTSTTNRSLLDSTPAVACTDHLVTSAPDSFLSRTQWGSGDSVSFTAPAGAKYMYIYVKWTTDATAIANILATIQVEKGSQATTYAPYFAPIELCKLGTYQDYIWKDGDSWKVHKAVAKHALKPNEGWLIPNPASYPNLFQTNAIGDLGKLSDAYTTASTSPQAYCETLVYLPGSGDVRTTQGFSLYHTTEGGVAYSIARINIAGFTTTTQLNNWLSTCNASFWYGVKNPTDTTITDTDLIAQLEAIRTASLENGTNTITNSTPAPNLAGDMEIDYYGYNPTNRYDKFIWLDINDNYEQIGE